MADEYGMMESGAPFNMAIATLMSLRNTLDKIRDIEARIEFPPEERQRIKIELVKRFFVDSSPLIYDPVVLKKFMYVLELKSKEVIKVDGGSGKAKKRIVYDFELNKNMDVALLNLQIELQKKKYYMPPKDDLNTIGMKMS